MKVLLLVALLVLAGCAKLPKPGEVWKTEYDPNIWHLDYIDGVSNGAVYFRFVSQAGWVSTWEPMHDFLGNSKKVVRIDKQIPVTK